MEASIRYRATLCGAEPRGKEVGLVDRRIQALLAALVALAVAAANGSYPWGPG
jgi:hypothetical protein